MSEAISGTEFSSIQLTQQSVICSYHGWQFEGSGKLKDIPQADDAKVLERAIKSQRSCCQVYPCQVDSLSIVLLPRFHAFSGGLGP
jgi:phenylpropionate dioxygenase-like ring-hydroxylating dioxygenase large terminal subunit